MPPAIGIMLPTLRTTFSWWLQGIVLNPKGSRSPKEAVGTDRPMSLSILSLPKTNIPGATLLTS